MIKGIAGYGYFDELCIPIIENTAWEHELADSLGEAIAKNPKSCAILVRRHGMYVWGKTWEEAKRHGECLHYLFEVAIQMKKLGMDFLRAPLPLKAVEDVQNKKRIREIESNGGSNGNHSKPTDIKYVLFDIEGTTTPITFVKDVLFPYSIKNFETYVEKNFNSSDGEVKADFVSLFNAYPEERNTKTNCIDVLTHLAQKDVKNSALKNIQGKIWDTGYLSGELTSIVYDDVLPFFKKCQAENIKIAIYSSGSRNAQRLLFKYSNQGDLRPYISCYFDTNIGQKQEKNSYDEIVKSLGVDSASEILFVTDILGESTAAKSAGMKTVLSVRAGNAPLPVGHPFSTVTTFDNLLNVV